MNKVNKTFTVELDSGKTFEIEVTGVGRYDGSYGADADGHRGSSEWFLANVEFELPKTDEYDNVLTVDELHELDIKLHKKALGYDWFFSTEDENEYEPEMEDL